MQNAIVPRRELNRLQTWEAIHGTASDMVLRDGLASTTVDSIADGAGVSRRTFFNYFPTKEDAVLGTRPARLTPEAVDAFESSTEDVFGRVVRLMTAAVSSGFHDLPSFSRQRELLRRHPELRTRLDQHVRSAEGLVHALLDGEELAASMSSARMSTRPGDSTRALLMIAGTVMRFAYTPDADGAVDNGPAAIDSAIIRFREVLKEVL